MCMNTRKNGLQVFIVAATSLLLCNSCSKINSVDENFVKSQKPSKGTTSKVQVKFLGHRGAGSNNYNDVNMENTIPSVVEALKVLEGVEVDMQMSLDGTIWLFHDADINRSLCNPGAARSIPTMRDSEISQLKLCSRTKKGRVYKFSELITLWNSYPKGFYIAMHIREDFPAATYNAVNGRPAYLKRLADMLAKEIELSTLKHSADQFLIEEEDLVLPNQLRKYPVGKKVKYFLFEYKTFDRLVADAIVMGFDGVSVNFTSSGLSAKKIQAAQARNIAVQVWTPYYDKDVQKVYNMRPDFIQTDQTHVKGDISLRLSSYYRNSNNE